MSLKKSKEQKMIAGVCKGMEKEWGIDVSLIRLGFVVTTLMGFGIPIIVYAVLAVILDEEVVEE